MYIYEPHQNLGRRLLQREIGLTSPVIYYWPFQDGASIVVYPSYNCLSHSELLGQFRESDRGIGRGVPNVFVRVLLVVDDSLILFRIAWWTSAWKELTSFPHVLFYFVPS